MLLVDTSGLSQAFSMNDCVEPSRALIILLVNRFRLDFFLDSKEIGSQHPSTAFSCGNVKIKNGATEVQQAIPFFQVSRHQNTGLAGLCGQAGQYDGV